MHFQTALLHLLGASFAAAYAVQPAGSSESIHVFSDYADMDVHALHVQTLFETLGGTFRFQTEDGRYTSISAIHLYKDASKYSGGGGNETNRFMQDVNDAFSLDDRSVGQIEARAPIQVNSRTCAKEGQHGDYAIAAAAQRNANAKFCHFLDTVTPSFWAVVGLTFSNVACGTRASPAQFGYVYNNNSA
ncbi:unnamed protein product [Zymoseptoria tritici ST99CH_3D7]|uniref:Uncharacterized protein n=1 Tax=Zymoseptoria tritici (strain ST99CH_3D7) TaxID=1276538 RepID=A0A1X7RPY1_ZYMT9|nr:unnamed protein product [Zymoseptoria tritici ST99CH_3D7]